MKQLPIALVFFRLIAGISLIPIGRFCTRPSILVIAFLLGVVSDILDGIIARRMETSTIELRRLDTRVDIIFYGCAIYVAFVNSPTKLAHLAPWLIAYTTLFVLRNCVDYLRYRASPAYHMWSGKLWSLLIGVQLVAMFIGVNIPYLFQVAFWLYAINAVEGIVASMILGHPRKDIPSLWHVLRTHRQVN